ncbi:MAG: DUF2206 domain-containing protein [Candidatus Bathyarchaeota archaeon]
MELRSVNTQNPKSVLLLVLLLGLVFCFVVFLDIPVARQVIGFFYLTFIPGFVILKLLKLDSLDRVEAVLFSVGLSVAFLMIAGLFINEFSLMFGFSQPLSLIPLMIFLIGPILIGGVLAYFKCKTVKIWNGRAINFSSFGLGLLFLCLPILSIIGTTYVTIYNNNLLLLFLIISIAILFIMGVLSKKLLSPKLYPFVVLLIAIALLYHSSLISNYIVPFGSDIPGEYIVFKTTQQNAHWGSTPSSWSVGISTYNDMLSITILPTIYTNLLNIDAQLLFKILTPLIFSFIPLGLYQLWQTYISKKYAFMASFLFMSQMTFYTEMLGLNRQIIAELFFVLLLLLIAKKMKPIHNIIFFMIFSFALVTSHYALATIFLFLISFTSIFLIILKRPSKNITISMVVLFFVIMFTWYIYTSRSATFQSILGNIDYVTSRLGEFFNLGSRGETILTGLGLAESPSIWNTISRMFAYITQAFIVFGFAGLVTKRVRTPIKKEFFIFSVLAMLLLVMLIAVPGLANTLNMTRLYHILLFLLAPLCIIGASVIVSFMSKRKKEFAVCALLLFVLVPYFLFQTNFVYEVTGTDSWSIPLSGYRMDARRLYGQYGYTDVYSVYGAHWLSENVDVKNSQLYADKRTATNVLTIHANIFGGKQSLSNVTIVADNGVIYLSSLNVVYDVVVFGRLSWNTSDLSFIFDDLNLVYTNGGSEVYVNRP